MNIDFSGKKVIVTGAGGAIGRASAALFAQLNAQVIAVDINAESVQNTVDSIASSGGSAVSLVADLTDADQATAMIDYCIREYAGIDVLFNNAGGSFPTPMLDIDAEEYTRLRALNFDAVYHASKQALVHMIANGGGVILTTTSGAGSAAVPGLAVYGSAKAGVNSLMRSIAIEFGKQGIRANAIAPAAASAGMLAWLETRPGGVDAYSAAQPMGRLGQPKDIAHVAAFLASDYAGFINGVVLPVDGGVEAMLAVPA